jgi:hypothetical protein
MDILGNVEMLPTPRFLKPPPREFLKPPNHCFGNAPIVTTPAKGIFMASRTMPQGEHITNNYLRTMARVYFIRHNCIDEYAVRIRTDAASCEGSAEYKRVADLCRTWEAKAQNQLTNFSLWLLHPSSSCCVLLVSRIQASMHPSRPSWHL